MVWLVLGPSKYSIYTAATISWGKSWPTLSLRLLLLPPLGRLLHFGFEWAAGSTTNSSFRYSLHPPVSSDDALFSQYGCENILLLVSFHQYTVNMVTSICRVRLSWWWSKTLPNSVVAFTKKGKAVHSIWQQTLLITVVCLRSSAETGPKVGEKVECATVSPHLYMLSHMPQVQCYPPFWQLHSDFGDFFDNGVKLSCHEDTLCNPNMGLSTQQTFCDVLARASKMPIMTVVSIASDQGCLSVLECLLQNL